MKTNELQNFLEDLNSFDRVTLDEVNFKFHVWRLGLGAEAKGWHKKCDSFLHVMEFDILNEQHETIATIPVYKWDVAGNRSALKMNRPENWHIYSVPVAWLDPELGWIGIAVKRGPYEHYCYNIRCQTEELAELSATIGAINLEKKKNQ
jgi:hypothetical protein